MLVYWKRFDKVEKEHRKKAEKEALEQRKQDEEMREVIYIVNLIFFFKSFDGNDAKRERSPHITKRERRIHINK